MYRLMIKTSSAGLKYLCISRREDYMQYTGSGLYWSRHLKSLGDKTVETQVLLETDSYSFLVEEGIRYSILYDVVDSTEWANAIIESGYICKQDKHWSDSKFKQVVCDKISQSSKIKFQNMSKEQLQEYTQKMRNGYNEWIITMSDEERAVYTRQLSESLKQYHSSLDEEQQKQRNETIRSARLQLSEEKKNQRKEKIRQKYETGVHDHLFQRYSKERLGSNNPNAKRVNIEGVSYGSISEAIEKLDLTRTYITYRVKSSKYEDWFYEDC